MAFHLAAFYGLIPTGSTASNLPAITDDVFAVENGALLNSTGSDVFAALAMGEDLSRIYVTTPRLRSLSPPYIRPIIIGATVPNDPNVAEWLDGPLDILPGESLSCQVIHDNVGTKAQYALLWLARELAPAPTGQVVTIRGYSVTATTANQWTDITMTWEQRPAGRYAVVACEVFSANPLGFRLKFDTDGFRPGGVTMGSPGYRSHRYFARPGTLGTWGQINAQVMPRLQLLSTAASSDHGVYMQIIPID